MDQEALVRSLLRRRAFPDHPARVRLVQTHLSWVFLTPTRVYKIKKAVNLGFANFSTLALRRRFCGVEVAVNRRLAPRVYLGVEPIALTRSGPVVGVPGRAVEYAVVMRRVPDARLLSRQLHRAPGDYPRLTRVAERLARFYAVSRVGPRDPDVGPRAVTRIVNDNFRLLEKFSGRLFDPEALADLRHWSDARHAALSPLIARRAREGRAVHGHGDLHLAHIYVDGDIEILDGTEFARRYRVGDVAQDVAFLAMDLEARGRHDLSRHLQRVLARKLRDPEMVRLLPWYKSYRALVRAKVNALMSAEHEVPAAARASARRRALRYFRLAQRIARWRGKPAIVVVGGLTGTGKTRIALDLAARFGMEWVATDVLRKLLAGIDPFESAAAGLRQGIYSAAHTRRTMAAVRSEAAALVRAGRPVVLDGTFQRRSDRDAVRRLGKRLAVPVRFVLCEAPPAVVQARLRGRSARPSISDAQWAVYQRMRRTFEDFEEIPAGEVLRLDTRATLGILGRRIEGFVGTLADSS